MALTLKIRRIDITDEDQTNPTDVDVTFTVHSDSADVPAAKGAGIDEVQRFVARCTSTRAAAATLLATCHLGPSAASLPAGVVALLVAAGIQNP